MMPRTETISISGMHCVACALNIERMLRSKAGIHSAQVNYAAGRAVVSYDPRLVTRAKIEMVIIKAGYSIVRAGPGGLAQAEQEKTLEEIADLKRRLLIAAGCAVPLTYIAMSRHIGLSAFELSPGAFALIQFLLTTPIMATGAIFFSRGIVGPLKRVGWRLSSQRSLFSAVTMDTLVAIGTGSAYLYSLGSSMVLWFGRSSPAGHPHLYYETAGVLITFILLGNWLNARAKGKTSEAIRKLLAQVPPTARVIRQGIETKIAASDIVVGERILIRPGERIPSDGIIAEGSGSLDESMVTGESIPVDKQPGQSVIGGTINVNGSFIFVAKKVGGNTFLAQVVRLVEQAQSSRAPVQDLADTVSRYFVPFVILTAVIAAVFWFYEGQTISFSLSIFIAVIMIACPCALGLATPTAVIAGTGTAARHGILVKDFAALQNLANADTFVFDKTGTVTRGKPEVTGFAVAAHCTENDVLKWAASVENLSEHVLAKTVVKYAANKGIRPSAVSSFHAFGGFGVAGTVSYDRIFVGKKEFMRDKQIPIDGMLERAAEKYTSSGNTVMWVSRAGTMVGVIALSDTVKPSASSAVSYLKSRGARIMMLTGDTTATALAVGAQVGIETVFAELSPKEKAHKVDELKFQGATVCMIGDGINDAPALVSANVGIAIGSGTDVSLEAADIVLIHSELLMIVSAVKISDRVMRTVKQNLFWAFGYNVIGMAVAAGVLYPSTGFLLNPIVAGAAMALSSVSVVFNSLLIRRFKG